MISLRQTFNRFRAFFRTDQLDSEVKDEMAAHLEMAVEENLSRGMSAEEARRQAQNMVNLDRAKIDGMTFAG